MKGCPLKCKWCANPEGQRGFPEIGFNQEKCIGATQCGSICLEVCPVKAITILNDIPVLDREICKSCGSCAVVCPAKARKLIGRYVTVDELYAEVEKDRPFYTVSGGGVTIGGGEPLAQFEFVLHFLKKLYDNYIHTAIETTGFTFWNNMELILEYLDLLYIDLKHMNPIRHEEITGINNKLILRNIQNTLALKPQLQTIIRIPLVPGCNDDQENIKATLQFVAEAGGKMVELLPYHSWGVSKYKQYGMKYELEDLKPQSNERMQELRSLATSFGLEVLQSI